MPYIIYSNCSLTQHAQRLTAVTVSTHIYSGLQELQSVILLVDYINTLSSERSNKGDSRESKKGCWCVWARGHVPLVVGVIIIIINDTEVVDYARAYFTKLEF